MTAAAADESGTSDRDRSGPLLGWRRYGPEAIGLVLLLVLADHLFFDGSRYDWMTPRPFWIPVVLISAQYGLAGGVFATLAATLALYSAALPSQLATQDYYAYSRQIVAEPTAWLACALVLGGLRSLHIFHAAELRQQRDDTLLEADGLGRGLSAAMAEIGRLELRFAAETRTLGAVGRAFACLDARDGVHLVTSLAEVGRRIVGASRLTVYACTPQGLSLLATVGEGGPRDRETAPVVDATMAEAVAQAPDRIWRRDRAIDARRLPSGAVLAVSIPGQAAPGPRGLLLVEGLLANQTIAEAAPRAQEMAVAMGGLMAGTDR